MGVNVSLGLLIKLAFGRKKHVFGDNGLNLLGGSKENGYYCSINFK